MYMEHFRMEKPVHLVRLHQLLHLRWMLHDGLPYVISNNHDPLQELVKGAGGLLTRELEQIDAERFKARSTITEYLPAKDEETKAGDIRTKKLNSNTTTKSRHKPMPGELLNGYYYGYPAHERAIQ